MKTKCPLSHRAFPAILGLLALSPLSSMASVLLHDGFSYSSGSVLGDNGGTGFNLAWTKSGAADSSSVNTGLSYTDSNSVSLSVAGNSLGITSSASEGVYRTFSAVSAASNATTTYWLAFIGDTSGTWNVSGNSNFAALTLRSGSTELLSVGTFGTSGAWRSRASNNGSSFTYTGTSGVALASTQAFIVVRLDVNTATAGNDAVYLWVNPDLSSTPSTSVAASALTGTNIWDSFSTDLLRVGTSTSTVSSKGINIDEISLGTDFASVAAIASVPEPAGVGAALGGVILTIAMGRRRRG